MDFVDVTALAVVEDSSLSLCVPPRLILQTRTRHGIGSYSNIHEGSDGDQRGESTQDCGEGRSEDEAARFWRPEMDTSNMPPIQVVQKQPY